MIPWPLGVLSERSSGMLRLGHGVAAVAVLLLLAVDVPWISWGLMPVSGAEGRTNSKALTVRVASAETPGASLRLLAQSRGIRIGAAAASGPLQAERRYAEILRHEFSMLTAENEMKFDWLHPDRNRYAFSSADALVAFARANDMAVRGHTLVWHESLPRWLTGGNFTREELLGMLREHIHEVVRHFQGQVEVWDVLNEAVAQDGSLRKTIWLRVIGPEYIQWVFRWAHEADPQARLFYNDNDGEGLGRKSDAIYDLVRGLVQRAVPIHGVGFQFHVNSESPPNIRDVVANMNRLAALGLEVHVTELDVRIRKPATAEKLDAQARIYRDILGACLTARNCKAFVLWGVSDRHSWIPQFFPGWGAGLILDEFLRPKPAYAALMDLLRER